MPTKASKLAPSAPLWVSRRSIRQRPLGPYLSCATRLAKMRAACLMLAASIVPKPLQMYFILPKLVIAKLGLGALLVTLSDVRGCVGSRRLGDACCRASSADRTGACASFDGFVG